MPTPLSFLAAGALGALVRDILRDNRLSLPSVVDGDLVLGFIGGMLVGAFVGWAVDQSVITAVFSGYVGTSTIKHLLPPDSE